MRDNASIVNPFYSVLCTISSVFLDNRKQFQESLISLTLFTSLSYKFRLFVRLLFFHGWKIGDATTKLFLLLSTYVENSFCENGKSRH